LTTSAKLLRLLPLVAAVGIGFYVWTLPRSEKDPGPPTTQSAAPRFEFREAGDEWGLQFTHDPGHPTFYYPEIMGSGLAVADFDNDGRLDVLLRGASPGKGHPHARSGPTSRLFLQRRPGRLEDATAVSGLDDDGYAMGVAVGDVNNDGAVDVYLCNFGKDAFYLGRGDGTFIDATRPSGIANEGFASSASFVDFDRDGRLDLYVANYVQYSKFVDCQSMGRRDYCQPKLFRGLPHKLYRNVTPKGAGPTEARFEDVSVSSGVAAKPARGLGVILCDANDDGWPDFYVANDDEPNFLWINQKNGKYVDSAATEAVAVNAAGESQGSMGLAEFDGDGDGKLDLLVTNFRAEYTTLYCRGAVGFQDRSGALGISALTRPFTGFGVAAVDVDGDGVDEIIQANGRVTQLEMERALVPPNHPSDVSAVSAFRDAYAERSQVLYRANGRYEDAKDAAGDFGQWVGIGRGLAVGDMNGDGRPDIVANDYSRRAKLFLNQAGPGGTYVSIRAVDPSIGGRDALGALVTLIVGDVRKTKRIRSCGSYQSANAPRADFGLGTGAAVERIEIVWPDGDLAPETFAPRKTEGAWKFERGRGRKLDPTDDRVKEL
jgi:enediyne biosynthesis protein E4